MTENPQYKLDVDKIKTIEDVKNVFELLDLGFYLPEDHKNYKLFKELTIPVNSGVYKTFALNLPKVSNYTCYLFGNRPGGMGMVYIPAEGQVPNRFVRFIMRICFDCKWVKDTP